MGRFEDHTRKRTHQRSGRVPRGEASARRHLAVLREAGERLGIDVLDADAAVCEGVRFLGAMLWTDFALHGREPRRIARAMADAQYGMNDLRVIHYGGTGMFRPEQARAIHLAQVRWLEATLASRSKAQPLS
jgi:hypothetical protein